MTDDPMWICEVRPAMARQDDLGRGNREVLAVMFAEAEEVEPDLVGQHRLFDDVAHAPGRADSGWPSASSVTSPKVSSPSSIASIMCV